MAVKLPAEVSKEIKRLTFEKADAFVYGSRSRTENGAFINSLVEDSEIGGRLREYMPANAVRTYIKDGVLNAYAKALVRKKFNSVSLETVIDRVYGVSAKSVGSINGTHIYRSDDNSIYLINLGTYLKWETALRKLLECVACNTHITEQAKSVNLCLLLAVSNGEMSFGDQQQIERALHYINVKVYFAR